MKKRKTFELLSLLRKAFFFFLNKRVQSSQITKHVGRPCRRIMATFVALNKYNLKSLNIRIKHCSLSCLSSTRFYLKNCTSASLQVRKVKLS